MNYSEMSDFEINKAVCEVILPNRLVIKSKSRPPAACVIDCNMNRWFDYCNSWADAGPIIERYMICLVADVFAEPQDGGKWVAQPAYGWDNERVRSDNPLRAAMIVFLMMQESK